MNIRSVQTEPATQAAQQVTPKTAQTAQQAQPVQTQVAADSFEPAQNSKLVNILQQEPDVRPDALERAKSLAADPNYPGADTVARLASLFIANPGDES